MIYFIQTQQHQYTMGDLMDSWAPEMRAHVKLLFFKDIRHLKEIPNGCYVFSDLERMDARSCRLLTSFRGRLNALTPKVQVMNEPSAFLNRYAFLKKMKDAGINRFDVHRCRKDLASTFAYPVFFRELHGHGATEIELIHDAEAFHAAFDRLAAERGAEQMEKDFVMIEYLDTSDANGVFRKYSYSKVGPHLVPRHINFDHQWVVKYPIIIEDALLQEEEAFVQNGQDEDQIDAIFKLAGIDCGRIDYSYDREGNIQVWEINTNPSYGTRDKANPRRFHSVESSVMALTDGYIDVAKKAPQGPPIPTSMLQRYIWKRHTDKYGLRRVK